MADAFKKHVVWWILAAVALTGFAIAANNSINSDVQDQPRNQSVSAPNLITEVELQYVAGGFTAPADIASAGNASDYNLYVVEQAGLIQVVDTRTGEKKGTLLDLRDKVLFEGEQGLLGLTFDPLFVQNGRLYINYVRSSDGGGRETVIARYGVPPESEPGVIQPAIFEKEILVINQPYANHNGGDLAFGPDGYLYIPTGDGGGAGDPQNLAQDRTSLLGKILRIDVRGNEPYTIPMNNPFVSDSSARPEIWSLGWRNPWRFSFDSLSGDMWVGDVGQNAIEEISVNPAGLGGLNFGWRCFEGTQQFAKEGCDNFSAYRPPITQYVHAGERCSGSVTGGYVYRGQSYPKLFGQYVYADFCTGKIYLYNVDDASAVWADPVKLVDMSITTFGEDGRGEIYLADAKNGTIYQIVLP